MNKIVILILFSFLNLHAEFSWIEIEIPVRDGKMLKADLYSSDTSISKPCILIQTPYNKTMYRTFTELPPQVAQSNTFFDTLNYNYVIMDWRGFFANKTASVVGKDRGEDGYDAVEWIANQKWSNGKIGTSGSSALGMIQFQTAKLHPPHLVCSAPFVKDYKTKYSDYYYGGVLRREHTEQLEKLGFITVEAITKMPIYNNTWKAIEKQSDYPEEFEVPMLLVSGWFDHYPSDVIRAFQDMKSRSHESVRSQHKLIMGPWTHSGLGLLKQGELEFPEAVGIPQEATKDFFDFYLRDIQNGWETKPAIKYFQMGVNIWKTTDDWNSDCSYIDTLYLVGLKLKSTPPAWNMDPRRPYNFTLFSDPKNPSPTVGGSRFNPFDPTTQIGPIDISETIEIRNDKKLPTTEVLEQSISITGKIKVELFIASDKKDTDFSVRLCDVYPDGKSYILTQGIKRTRFRESLEVEKFLTGAITQITIELDDIAVTFVEGHRMRIVITNTNYPMFDINPNTGGEMYIPDDTLSVFNLVFIDVEYPSKVIFSTNEPMSVEKRVLDNDNFNIYPNPFTETANIHFSLNIPCYTKLTIYNTLGYEVSTLVNEYLHTGNHEFTFDGFALPCGAYFYVLQAGSRVISGKLILIK